jgi:hypothetical protein
MRIQSVSSDSLRDLSETWIIWLALQPRCIFLSFVQIGRMRNAARPSIPEQMLYTAVTCFLANLGTSAIDSTYFMTCIVIVDRTQLLNRYLNAQDGSELLRRSRIVLVPGFAALLAR